MRPASLVATYVLALSCAFLALSCIQAAPETSSAEPDNAQSPAAAEPTEEAREPLPVVHYDPSDFPFVTTIPDDGRGKGGGWQVAHTSLSFWKIVIPRTLRHWECSLIIEMPLRTEHMGRIPARLAAKLSVEVAGDAARAMDFDLPQVIFCQDFAKEMLSLFKSRYPLLGARVTR